MDPLPTADCQVPIEELTQEQMVPLIAAAAGHVPDTSLWGCRNPNQDSFCMSGTKRECDEWLQKLPDGSPYRAYIPTPLPVYLNYFGDLNAIHLARKARIEKDLSARVKYLNALREIVGRRREKNKAGAPLVSDFDLINAEPHEHAEAFLRTIRQSPI